jgi:hypothetical protein
LVSEFSKTPDGRRASPAFFILGTRLVSTQAQIAANKTNAQHSTGPKTDEGKSTVSQNNFRHGLAGKWILLPDEDPTEFKELFESLRNEHQPSTPTETLLVEQMAQHYWVSQRALRLQTTAFENLPEVDEKKLALYIRYHSTQNRAFHKSLNDLLRLRAEKRKAEIGFESQTRKQEEDARKKEMHEARVRVLNAKASDLELDTDIRQTVEARLPGHTAIPFETLKGVLKLSLEEVAWDLAKDAEKAA